MTKFNSDLVQATTEDAVKTAAEILGTLEGHEGYPEQSVVIQAATHVLLSTVVVQLQGLLALLDERLPVDRANPFFFAVPPDTEVSL